MKRRVNRLLSVSAIGLLLWPTLEPTASAAVLLRTGGAPQVLPTVTLPVMAAPVPGLGSLNTTLTPGLLNPALSLPAAPAPIAALEILIGAQLPAQDLLRQVEAGPASPDALSAQAGQLFDFSAPGAPSDGPTVPQTPQGPSSESASLEPVDSSRPTAVPAPSAFNRLRRQHAESREPVRRILTTAARVTGLYGLWTLYRDGVLVQKLAGQLADSKLSPARRATSARLLGALGRVETLEALGYAAAHDPNARVRRVALAGVLHIAQQSTAKLTRDARLHPLAGRRETAARSLGWIARFSQEPAVVDALADAAALDLKEDVRLTAIGALAMARSPKAAARLAWMRQRAEEPHIRSALEVALAQTAQSRQTFLAPIAHYQPPAGEFEATQQPLYSGALKKVLAIGAFFVTIELVGSYMLDSVSLRANAIHMAADLAITAGSLFAVWMSRRPPTSRKTYGYLKMESVMGLLSSAAIGLMAFEMVSEAIPRLWAPVAMAGWPAIWLAVAALASNGISSWILYRYRDENLSLKGAFLHAASDAVGSFGIIVAAALGMALGWAIADPIISILIVGLIIHTTWDLAKKSWNVLIDAVPPGLDLDALEAGLLAIPGVVSVHDLHAWSLNSSETVVTAKLYVSPGAGVEDALKAARLLLQGTYKVRHTTIQVETLRSPS